MESRFVIDTSQKLPEGQNWFIKRLVEIMEFEPTSKEEKERQKLLDSGWCFGMSMMWMQAFLADQPDVFKKRLQAINQFRNGRELKQGIEKVKQLEIAILAAEKKKAANKELSDEEKLLIGKKLSDDEKLLLDIPIFLSNVLNHQVLHTERMSALYTRKPTDQHPVITETYVIS